MVHTMQDLTESTGRGGAIVMIVIVVVVESRRGIVQI